MASVTAFIRTSAKKTEKVKIRFRLSDGRRIQLFHKSEIEVDPKAFDPKTQGIKAKVIYDGKTKINNAIGDRKKLIRSIYDSTPGLTSEQLDQKLDQVMHPEKYAVEESAPKPLSYFKIYDQFLNQHKVSEGRLAHFKVLKRALMRYELYRKIKLDINTTTKDTVRDIEAFLKDELSVFEKHPDIYKKVPEAKARTPKPRGVNTVSGMLSRYRTFCHWLVDTNKTTNMPFKGYSIEQAIYGTPFYISIDERNLLSEFDLSDLPDLAIQRDIFIFQCLVGCRIGDLYNLTSNSVISGAIEYVAQKTKDERPLTVRVPLNAKAQEILNRYPAIESAKLLPFIAEQNYNEAIKKMFKAAKLTRLVTVINPTTREEEKRPLNEIASSHIARRCFIGNLYKKVKDPSLVGALSGHTEGSKAFARYREIDEEMKKDLVNLLD